MKLNMAFLLVAIVALTSVAHANERGNGGDICQERIEEIRNNIAEWIQAGNSALLNFKQSDTTLADYNSKMQDVIMLTRLHDQTSISCTDDERTVQVEGAQKTCVAYPDAVQPKIVCYRGESSDGRFISGFMGLSDDNQYFQVHHELAVLAGIEDQAGENTDYPLSNQISSSLVEVVVKQLPIEPIQHSPFVGRWSGLGTYNDVTGTQQCSFEILVAPGSSGDILESIASSCMNYVYCGYVISGQKIYDPLGNIVGSVVGDRAHILITDFSKDYSDELTFQLKDGAMSFSETYDWTGHDNYTVTAALNARQ